MPDLFPRGVAYGEAFYNRDTERKTLKQAIEHGHHTVLVAPRRYGKTSLMRKVIAENNYPYIWVDFMTFTSRQEAEEAILQQLAQLVIEIGKTEDKVKNLAKQFLAFLKPEITINVHSVMNIHFHPNFNQHDTVMNTLIAVDHIAQKTKTRAVLVFDEFQEIVGLDERNTFQASIRHAAEQAQCLTYLFSGSRHLSLRTLFTGKKNPLYELCDLLPLARVSKEYYLGYLQEKAQQQWGHAIDDQIIEKILHYTECYPKYVNAVCGKIWISGLAPTKELVDVVWEDLVFSRKDDIYIELSSLKLNERKLLRLICEQPTDKPYAIDYAAQIGLSPTSLRRALEEGLLKKEIVMVNYETGVFSVIDPVLKAYLTRY